MRNLKIFIVLIMIAGVIGISGNAFALSQPNIECQQASICVHPGDFITYSTEFDQVPAIETYTFGDFIGTDKVSVSITSISNDTKIQSNNILDLKTGFYNETVDGGGLPILVMAPIPINIDKNIPSISEKTQNFNGSKRSVISLANNTDTSKNEIGYDKETGVLMYLHLVPQKSTSTNSLDLNYPTRYDLINTNMFANSSAPIDLQIPSWIKNNAKWWSHGDISDNEFVKGIQYLIQHGMMKIPSHSDSSLSQQIPSWVKTNAGWWASGQISDDEFVKGIQYLTNSGIIRV